MKTPIIDSHVHALPSLVMDTYRQWLLKERPAQEGTPNMWASPAFEHPAEQITALDQHQIDSAVLTFSSNAPAAMHVTAVAQGWHGPKMVGTVNDQLITWAQESQGRLHPTAFIEPRFGEDAIQEMERLKDLVPAFSMLCAYRGPGQPLRFLDHPDFRPVLAHAASLKQPLYIHTSGRFNLFADIEENPLPELATTYLRGGISMLVENTICLVRLALHGVFDRYPDLRLVFGQLGGLFPFILGRFDLIYELVVVAARRLGDTSMTAHQVKGITRRLRDYVEHIYVDTHSMDRAALLCAIEALGSDRILFGSDFPVTPVSIGREQGISTIRSLPVSQEVQAAILGGNAARLLSIGQEALGRS